MEAKRWVGHPAASQPSPASNRIDREPRDRVGGAGQVPANLLSASALAAFSGDFDGRIAQLVEQLTLNQRVHSSSLCAPTIEINDLEKSHRVAFDFADP